MSSIELHTCKQKTGQTATIHNFFFFFDGVRGCMRVYNRMPRFICMCSSIESWTSIADSMKVREMNREIAREERERERKREKRKERKM
jgi:hypothetical protein